MAIKNLTEEKTPHFTLVEDVTAYDEAGKPKLPPGVIQQVRFKAGKAGQITANGRLYTKKLMKREVERIQPRIARRAVKVLSGHPEQGKSPDPEREIGVLTGLSMLESQGPEDGDVIATMDVIPTTAGNNFAAKTRARTEVGFSSRGPGTATVVRFTDQHEDFGESNKDWVGKEIEQVNEDFTLTTYDHVLGQAVEDAVGLDYHESKKENGEMELDISKLTEEQWAEILKSKKVTDALGEAVEAAVKEVSEDLVKEEAAKYVEDFINENFDIVEDDDSDDEDDLDEAAGAKCPECGAGVGKGAKFCPSCGLKISKMEVKTPDEKDAEIAKLKKENEERDEAMKEMAEQIKAMQEREQDREEAEKVEEILMECLAGKPEALVAEVLDRLSDADIDPENAKELVEAAVVKVEAFVKNTGGDLTEAMGTATVKRGDEDEPENKNLTEDQKNLDDVLED